MENETSLQNFWTYSSAVSIRLLQWSSFSVGSGIAMILARQSFWRGMGTHFITWGIIDAVIALFGLVTGRQKQQQPVEDQLARLPAERRNLRNLLWINTGLDVVYILGGIWMMRRKGEHEKNWQGQGLGIIVQGGFLFIFDLIHALRVPLGREEQ